MTTTESESPCDFHCGYVGPPDQDFRNHVIWEHRASCTECGARKGPERWCSLTHRLDCPRLQPGYTYPPVTAGEYEDAGYVAEHGDEDLDTGHLRDPEGDEAAHG